MGAPAAVALPINVAPSQTIDLSVNMFAPNAAGHYEGLWELQSAEGKSFGIGGAAKDNIWVRVRVIEPAFSTPTTTPGIGSATPPAALTATTESPIVPAVQYDLGANACAAQWQSNDGPLPCPGINGDPGGFVFTLDQAHLEDGSTASLPTLLTFPRDSADGYILGVFPDYDVQAGDHFQATVGCEQNALSCSVLFRLSYLDAASTPHDLWTLGEFYDGKYFNLDLDLSRLAGQKIKLILNVAALGSSTDDRALWVAPRIVNFPVATATSTVIPTATVPASSTPTFTPVPSATSIPPTAAIPTAAPVSPAQPPTIPQIIDSIVNFFQQLLGGK